jgi:hypothetical protein
MVALFNQDIYDVIYFEKPPYENCDVKEIFIDHNV